MTDLRRPEAIVYRGLQYRKSRVRLRLEVVLENDAAVDDAVEAVLRAAGIGEGRRGGEDVFLMNVEDVRSMPARTTGVRRWEPCAWQVDSPLSLPAGRLFRPTLPVTATKQ